jgi:hypothetical protein
MRKRAHILTLAILFLTTAAHAQATLEMMRLKLRQFDYARVVGLADTLLQQASLTPNERIEILETQGIAQYSLQELDGALATFAALLKIAPDCTLDPGKTSPKIIRFFDEIKESLAQQKAAAATVRIDTVRLYDQGGRKLPGAMVRSLLWPGWGHLYQQRRNTGIALAAANLALLGSSLYFAGDCRDKQHAYLSAAEESLIAGRYQSYNTAYKTRNALIASYALFWLLSQADLLIFHPPPAGSAAAWIVPNVELTGQGIKYSCTIRL